MNHKKHALLLTFALGFGVANLPAQNLLQNGSFEQGNWSQNSQFTDAMTLDNGSAVITGWTVGKGSGNFWWYTTPIYNAQDGLHCVDFDSNLTPTPSYIEQTFNTTVGTRYRVSAYFASEENSGPAVTAVKINGSAIGSETTGPYAGSPGPGNLAHMVWTPASFDFTANSTSSTLRFEDATVGTYFSGILDNVSVTVVPEPSMGAFALVAGLGFWLAGLRGSRPARGREIR